jgi:zinc protease
VEPKIEKEPVQKSARKREIKYEGKTLPLMLVGYKNEAFDPKNKNLMALLPFAELCFGETSDLYKKLVLDEQKVQYIGATPGFARDPYLFEISVMVKSPKDMEEVYASIQDAVDTFKKKTVEPAKLAELKRRLKYSFLMSLDNADAVAGFLPKYITMTGDIDAIDEMYQTLESISAQDIQAAVNKYFVAARENMIVLKGEE